MMLMLRIPFALIAGYLKQQQHPVIPAAPLTRTQYSQWALEIGSGGPGFS